MDCANLDERQLDALKEISNIGMGHAATALSQLLGKTVLLDVPNVVVTQIAQVPTLLGGPERLVVGIYLQILGDARGSILLIFPRESAFRLIDSLVPGEKCRPPLLSELQLSALKEVGNILAASYLNALGTMLKMTLIPSIPMLSFDMAGAVVDYVLIGLGEYGDLSLMVETNFRGTEGEISGHFFLIPDLSSLDLILSALAPHA